MKYHVKKIKFPSTTAMWFKEPSKMKRFVLLLVQLWSVDERATDLKESTEPVCFIDSY